MTETTNQKDWGDWTEVHMDVNHINRHLKDEGKGRKLRRPKSGELKGRGFGKGPHWLLVDTGEKTKTVFPDDLDAIGKHLGVEPIRMRSRLTTVKYLGTTTYDSFSGKQE